MERKRTSRSARQGFGTIPEPSRRQRATDSNDWHEDIDNVVAPAVLERRSRAVGIRPLRKALRSRAYLLVDAGRLTLQSNAGVPPTRECAALGPDRRKPNSCCVSTLTVT